MEPNNVNWKAAFHKNTDIPHVHFYFEKHNLKEWIIKQVNGKWEFTDPGRMSKKLWIRVEMNLNLKLIVTLKIIH